MTFFPVVTAQADVGGTTNNCQARVHSVEDLFHNRKEFTTYSDAPNPNGAVRLAPKFQLTKWPKRFTYQASQGVRCRCSLIDPDLNNFQ